MRKKTCAEMRETMNIVVITGASSGMGREFAMQLDRGLHSVDEFWLIARRGSRLKEIASGMQHTVKILPLDLTNEADMTVLTESLAEEKPVVRMLINCAGYGMMGDFTAVPIKEQTGEVDLNCRALLEVTYGCLPYMRAKSRIIQLASSAAFLPQPGFSVYAATKSFVLSFSKALRAELKERQIYVTAVCPGPVKTEFFEVAEHYASTLAMKQYTMVEADRVVKDALRASSKNRPMSVCSLPIQAFWAMTRLLPQDPVICLVQKMREKGTEVIEEEKESGQKGYLAWNKKMSICKTLALFAISFAVYAMGIWSTGSNQNLLTIVAVLGCLPACRSAANLIALLRCHEISESDYRKISAKIRTAESLTDLEFTSYERTYQVQHMALSGVELIGYMADPFADIKGCEKHLEGMFLRNQLSEVHIRIFKELPKYLNRLDELEKASAAGDNTEEETERTARIKALLFAISL